jgi:glycerol uptake facilitator-like aquaporin
MSETYTKPSIFAKAHFSNFKSAVLVEFVGTFLFVLTIALSVNQNAEVAPIAIGFMLMVMIFTFGYISGGHFNPSVSLAVFLSTSSFKIEKLVVYVVAQVAGACAATVYFTLIQGPSNMPSPMPATFDFISLVRVFLAESTYTFMLASVVLHVACSKQKNNNFYGFAIGMTVLAGALTVGGVSGAAFNPAVATGLTVIKCLFLQCGGMATLWLYLLSHFVGSIVASIFYLATVNIDDTF